MSVALGAERPLEQTGGDVPPQDWIIGRRNPEVWGPGTEINLSEASRALGDLWTGIVSDLRADHDERGDTSVPILIIKAAIARATRRDTH